MQNTSIIETKIHYCVFRKHCKYWVKDVYRQCVFTYIHYCPVKVD